MPARPAIPREPSLLDDAVECQALEGHDGRSGARLERVQLPDGSSLIVKRMAPGSDILMRMTSDPTGRELALWRAGVLDRLPDGVDHAILEGWQERDGTVVIVMRDLGRAVLGWHRHVSRRECRTLLGSITAVHAAYAEVAASIPLLCPLASRLRMLWPGTMAQEVDGDHPLPRLVVRGWELFADLVPGDVADVIGWVHEDVARLSGPLSTCTLSLVHGDFWLVNVALEDGCVVLLDWGAASLAPPAFDLACFLVGNATHVDAPREMIIDDFVTLSADLHDDRALKLCLVAALAELGWNKALDIVDHPDAVARGIARDELDWWTAAVRRVADEGALS